MATTTWRWSASSSAARRRRSGTCRSTASSSQKSNAKKSLRSRSNRDLMLGAREFVSSAAPHALGSPEGREKPMTQFWMLWPDNPALSIFVLAIVAMVFLYAARKPMHDLIRAVGALLGGPLRLAARWLIDTAAEMKARNKAVLLAHGRQETGQRIEREFERLAAVVKRELQGYP